MKFTITRQDLLKMLKQISRKQPGSKYRDSVLRLSACAPRIFVESNQTIAGVEALVLVDGACTLDREKFMGIVQSYKDRPNLMIEVNERYLQIANTRLDIKSYAATATPPAKFQVFPVTDTWLARTKA